MNDVNKQQMIEDYLSGRLSKEDYNAFKKELFENHSLAEEVNINRNLFALYNTDSGEF